MPSGFKVSGFDKEDPTIKTYGDLVEAYESGFTITHEGKEVENFSKLLEILLMYYSGVEPYYDTSQHDTPLLRSIPSNRVVPEPISMTGEEFIGSRGDIGVDGEIKHNEILEHDWLEKLIKPQSESMVHKPKHYIGEQGLEVETVLQNFVPRYKNAYVGHRISSSLEYLLRAPLKNKKEDLEKAKKNIEQALNYLEEQDIDTF